MIWNRYSEEVFKYRCLISDYGGLAKLQKHASYLWEPKSFKQQAAFELAARLEAEQKIWELEKELTRLEVLLILRPTSPKETP